MKKTKVLFIWHAGVVKIYQKYVEELAEHEDLDIILLVPKWSCEGSKKIEAYIPQNKKYKVMTAWNTCPGEPLIGLYPALPLILAQIKPDIIHLFEEPWHNIAGYLTLCLRLICPKAKLIFQTFQNQIENYPNNWIRVQNGTFNRSLRAIACSEEIKDVLLHWGYKKPIDVIYPGVETKLFGLQDASNLRSKLGLKEFTIGYFGRMLKEKGIEDLIQACSKLDFPYKLLFIGNGQDKSYFKSLTNKAVWIDAVNPEEISSYYSALDVFVLPSRTTPKWKEQFGRVLVESMLCGTPVIGSSSGEIPKVIGDAGLTFKEQDSADLADKISQIYYNLPLRNDLTKKGLIRGKLFDWKNTADQTYKVYKSETK